MKKNHQQLKSEHSTARESEHSTARDMEHNTAQDHVTNRWELRPKRIAYLKQNDTLNHSSIHPTNVQLKQ
jgi:hypothetical protein